VSKVLLLGGASLHHGEISMVCLGLFLLRVSHVASYLPLEGPGYCSNTPPSPRAKGGGASAGNSGGCLTDEVDAAASGRAAQQLLSGRSEHRTSNKPRCVSCLYFLPYRL
jgi:hypothetical protein